MSNQQQLDNLPKNSTTACSAERIDNEAVEKRSADKENLDLPIASSKADEFSETPHRPGQAKRRKITTSACVESTEIRSNENEKLGTMRVKSKNPPPQSSQSHQPARKYKYLLKKKTDVKDDDNQEDKRNSYVYFDANSFEDLVIEGTLVIDRSSFIQSIFELRKQIGIFVFALPPGCGKTCLVTMFHDFVDEESSGCLFYTEFEDNRTFKIMSWTNLSDHFCAYPTLFIDFSDVFAKNANDVEKKINNLLEGIFSEKSNLRKWMIQVGKRKEAKKFDKYFSKMKKGDWKNALKFLCRYLNERSEQMPGKEGKKKKTIIIFDGYDTPIVKYKGDVEEFIKIVELVQYFTLCLFAIKNYTELIVITGNYTFGLGELANMTICMERDLSSIEKEKIGIGKNIVQYFGLQPEEVQELCLAYNISSKLIASMAEYFNGIHICSVPLYSTRSIIKMLACAVTQGRNSLHAYFEPTPFFTLLEPIFKNELIVKMMMNLIKRKKCNLVWQKTRFTDTNLTTLLSYTKAQSSPRGMSAENLLIRFLNMSGYLVRIGNKLVIPNKEMLHTIGNLFWNQFYESKYNFTFTDLTTITDAIELIALDLNPTKEQMRMSNGNKKEALEQQLASAIENFLQKNKKVGRNEPLLQTIIGMACILMRYCTDCNLDKVMGGFAGKDSQKRPDVVLSSSDLKNFCMCIELKCFKESLDIAMGQIVKNHYLLGSEVLNVEEVQSAVALAIRMKEPEMDGSDDVEVRIERFERCKNDANVGHFLKRFEDSLLQKYKDFIKSKW